MLPAVFEGKEPMCAHSIKSGLHSRPAASQLGGPFIMLKGAMTHVSATQKAGPLLHQVNQLVPIAQTPS
jgi:hypothetical protein